MPAIRKHFLWDGSDWDDGYLGTIGRFLVYRPDYPRAYKGGYAQRAHVVWWLYYDEVHPDEMALHHKNGIKTDDEIDNLELMDHGEHTRFHCSKPGVELICERCERPFRVPAWRIRSRVGRGGTVKFCSNRCRCSGPRGDMLP